MPASKLRLLLAYGPELVDGAPLSVSCNSAPIPWVGKEPAGLSFHKAALRQAGCGYAEEDIDTSAAEKKQTTGSPAVDSYHFKGKKKNATDGDQQDHYALLGLSHVRFLATEEQIRKSYRDVALKHHPDKQAMLLLQEETSESREAKRMEIDRHFKSIQEAYEVLMDPNKRRLYDSIDEFDDEVPSDCSPEDFFLVYGPVFLRNGRWSVAQPVPTLGDGITSIGDVDAFYDFWWSFKSWREFPHADEFDLEQAESREHRRWMERQNGKLREKAKREENGRIRMLIENAYKRDPRILRRKEEAKAEKLRKKQERVLAKQEKELEAARLVEEERLRKLEEDRKVALEAAAVKKVREKEKKILRKERQRLRAAAAAVTLQETFSISDDAVESLCSTLEIAEMTLLCQKLEDNTCVEEQADILRRSLRGTEYEELCTTLPIDRSSGRFDQDELSLDQTTETSAECKLKSGSGPLDEVAGNGVTGSTYRPELAPKSSSAINGSDKKERPWTKEEVELLKKAVVKYPKGTSQRWEVVSNYLGSGRTVDEILRAIKTVLLQKPDSSKAFDSFLSKRKPAKGISSPLSTRDDGLDGIAGSASVASPLLDSSGKVERPCFNGKGSPRPQESCVQKKEPFASELQGKVSLEGDMATGDQDVWSEMQELALVKALKTFPKDVTQRWERIAAAVPGKTKTQCFKKFAELRDNFRSKKGLD